MSVGVVKKALPPAHSTVADTAGRFLIGVSDVSSCTFDITWLSIQLSTLYFEHKSHFFYHALTIFVVTWLLPLFC